MSSTPIDINHRYLIISSNPNNDRITVPRSNNRSRIIEFFGLTVTDVQFRQFRSFDSGDFRSFDFGEFGLSTSANLVLRLQRFQSPNFGDFGTSATPTAAANSTTANRKLRRLRQTDDRIGTERIPTRRSKENRKRVDFGHEALETGLGSASEGKRKQKDDHRVEETRRKTDFKKLSSRCL